MSAPARDEFRPAVPVDRTPSSSPSRARAVRDDDADGLDAAAGRRTDAHRRRAGGELARGERRVLGEIDPRVELERRHVVVVGVREVGLEVLPVVRVGDRASGSHPAIVEDFTCHQLNPATQCPAVRIVSEEIAVSQTTLPRLRARSLLRRRWRPWRCGSAPFRWPTTETRKPSRCPSDRSRRVPGIEWFGFNHLLLQSSVTRVSQGARPPADREAIADVSSQVF